MRRTVAAAVALLALFLQVRPANSLCSPASFEQLITWAKIIFAGTVTEKACVPMGGSVATVYHFQRIRYLKGEGPSDSLTLVQDGGTYGHEIVSVEHEPSFEVGRRYILPAMPRHGSAAFRAPGCSFAFFVAADSGRSDAVVRQGSAALAFFDERHAIWVQDRAWRSGDPLPSFDRVVLGDPSSVPPPRRTLREVLRLADSADAARRITLRQEGYRDLERDQMIPVGLYRHQDLGTRVTEEQFALALKEILARLARLESAAPAKAHPVQ